jgi:hypothetical protein
MPREGKAVNHLKMRLVRKSFLEVASYRRSNDSDEK